MQGYRLPVDDHRRVTIDERVGAFVPWTGRLIGHPRDGYAVDLSEGEPVMTAPPLLVGSPTTIQFLIIGRSLAEPRFESGSRLPVLRRSPEQRVPATARDQSERAGQGDAWSAALV